MPNRIQSIKFYFYGTTETVNIFFKDHTTIHKENFMVFKKFLENQKKWKEILGMKRFSTIFLAFQDFCDLPRKFGF